MIMTIVDDFIATEVAALERVVDLPEDEVALGYGSDLSCVTDMTAKMVETDPQSRVGLAEALLRRILTERGTLPDDEDYGRDVRALLNRGLTVADLRAEAGLIRAELEEDDRVDDVSVTLVMPTLVEIFITLVITAADPALGSFTATARVTDSSVVLEIL